MNKLDILFKNAHIKSKIQKKLPELFQLAEYENSRNGKLGMEIGSVRERIIIALLLYQFGRENVLTDIPIKESEIDVIVFKKPISIKTLTSKKISTIKLIWTVDQQKATEFIDSYQAYNDMLFIHINWSGKGGFYLIPKEVQNSVLKQYGKDFYFILPKTGTNSRGIGITSQAMNKIVSHTWTQKIEIAWARNISLSHNVYDRWIDLWR